MFELFELKFKFRVFAVGKVSANSAFFTHNIFNVKNTGGFGQAFINWYQLLIQKKIQDKTLHGFFNLSIAFGIIHLVPGIMTMMNMHVIFGSNISILDWRPLRGRRLSQIALALHFICRLGGRSYRVRGRGDT